MAFLLRKKDFSQEFVSGYSNRYMAICFGLPLILTLLPLSTDSYGDTGGWCWITQLDSQGLTWRMIQFYIPLWIVVLYNSYVYYKVYNQVKDMNAGRNTPEAKAMMEKIRYYPLVLIVCEFWASVNAISETILGLSDKSNFIMWLNVLQIAFASSIGMANAMVYGLTPTVSEKLTTLCGKGNPEVAV